MTLFHLFLLAMVQGLTEFLPISSSGHLILFPSLTGLQDQGQTIDVAVHVGTLGAVVLYFWKDVKVALAGIPRLIRWQIDGREAWLALCLGVATIPVVIVGLIFHLTGFDDLLRSPTVIGVTMLGFGIVLYFADRTGPQERTADSWTLRHALNMGLWQAVALVPGTSRSGITITAARHLGYTRTDAARLSMLMSIPAIIASGTLVTTEVVANGELGAFRDAAIAAVLSFIAALFAIAVMMRLLRHMSFTPYVIYRVILGAVLIWIGMAA